MEKQFKMKVIASEGQSFGAYLEGSAKDGEAIICLDVLACLAVDKDPKKCMAEVLSHEVLHACQDVMGEALTENDIVNALEKIRGVELQTIEEGEVDEKVIRPLVNKIQKLSDYVKELEIIKDKYISLVNSL